MYTIQTRPVTYITGKTNEEKQVLLGWLDDSIAVVIFDGLGTLLESRKCPLNIDLDKGLGPDIERIADKKIQLLQQQLGLCEGPIQVKEFFIEAWTVGLKQFPLDLEEYLANPDGFSEEDAEIFRKDIEQWKSAGNCALFWGSEYNDYLLGRDGGTI